MSITEREREILATVDELISEVREAFSGGDGKEYLASITQVVHLLKLKIDMLPQPLKTAAAIKAAASMTAPSPPSDEKPQSRAQQIEELRELMANVQGELDTLMVTQ